MIRMNWLGWYVIKNQRTDEVISAAINMESTIHDLGKRSCASGWGDCEIKLRNWENTESGWVVAA